jgi:phosphatidate cytidylyltransferase
MKKISHSLALRLLSSLVLIPVFIVITIMGDWAFAGIIALCIGIAMAEWVNITKHISSLASTKVILILLGILYIGSAYLEMIFLRLQTDGVFWVIVFMMCIWASDSLAYAVGKNIGGPKMTPTISPNKTWSGYVGAMIGPAIVLTLCVHFFPQADFNEEAASAPVTFLFGMMIGICGQSGDLLISMMKRKAGLKDTGALIPGHGGILDRIDAMLMAFPIYIAYITYITR